MRKCNATMRGCALTAVGLWGTAWASAQVQNLTTTEMFTTIQAAIDDADTMAGDVIEVSDGTYVENVLINKNITLRSVNGRAATTIQGISMAGALGAVQVAPGSNGVTIGEAGKGFTIQGIDNGAPGIENAAVYFQGTHSNATIQDNEIVANGDVALLTEFGQSITNFEIDGNIFSGATFTGPEPAGTGFGMQFTLPNVPRQLVVMGCGTNCTTTSGIQFTNNQIIGTAGGTNMAGEQGNTLVTIDAANVTITGNTFAGTTTRFGSTLRARGSNTTISGNTFDGSGQTPTTNYLFIANPNTSNGLSIDPATLADARDDNSYSPPALIVPGQPTTLFVGFFNQLALEIDDCPDDTDLMEADYQIEIELWMRDLSQDVTGFAAFLAYDNAQLTYRGDLSSYTMAPFASHITAINVAEVAAGELRLDGSDIPMGAGTNVDSLLAVLVFDVNVECGAPDLTFDLTQMFASELSFEGSPIPTPLVNTPAVTLDDTPPLLTAPMDEELECSTELPLAAMTLGDFLALAGAGATDNCALPDPMTAISSMDGGLIGDECSGTITRTYTIADACGNTATVDHVFNVSDDTDPIATAPTAVDLECSDDLPDAATNITEYLALSGAAASDNCTATASLTVSSVDVVIMPGECAGMIARTYTIADECGNSTDAVHEFTVTDNTDPQITCLGTRVVNADAGGCTAVLQNVETFDTPVPLCPSQTSFCWYTDRYAPAAFESAIFDGGNRLKHSISVDDAYGNRPGGFQNDFYATQGRKYDINLPIGSTLGVDLYIPLSWATDARRADIWATTYDTQGAISGFPIVGFINNDPMDPWNPNPSSFDPRFRIFTQDTDNNPGNGLTSGWVELAPPGGMIMYDTWYRLEITLTATSYEFKITDQASNMSTYTDNVTFGSVRIGNTIIQAYNFSNSTYPLGDSYDVWWDNLEFGPQLPAVTDNCCLGTISVVRSDNAMLTLADPFPTGNTTLTWTATDCCGNSASCNQTITVTDRNIVQATVQLEGVDAGAGLTRCIKFTAKNGTTCAADELVEVEFAGNPATGVVTLDVECGNWNELCAKDEQHTLYASQPIAASGAIFVNASPIVLMGGDNDNDSDVDINDVTWFIFQFGGLSVDNPTCDPWTGTLRDADYNNDGAITNLDYTFITTNWLTFSTCPCTTLVSGGGKKLGNDLDPISAQPVKTEVLTSELPATVARKVDVNRDGVVNYLDVAAFEVQNGLSGELSSKLAATAETVRPTMTKTVPTRK